ncbi:hypothetical protein Tco_1356893, partial [Tanacetum coccineum]
MPRGSTDPDDDNLFTNYVSSFMKCKRKLDDRALLYALNMYWRFQIDNANVNAHEMSPASTNPNDNNLSKEGVGNSDNRPQQPISISSAKYFPVLTAMDSNMALTVVMSGVFRYGLLRETLRAPAV